VIDTGQVSHISSKMPLHFHRRHVACFAQYQQAQAHVGDAITATHFSPQHCTFDRAPPAYASELKDISYYRVPANFFEMYPVLDNGLTLIEDSDTRCRKRWFEF